MQSWLTSLFTYIETQQSLESSRRIVQQNKPEANLWILSSRLKPAVASSEKTRIHQSAIKKKLFKTQQIKM